MVLKIDIKGMVSTLAFMKAKETKIKSREAEALREASFYVQKEVKESLARGKHAATAFDTGNLTRSVTAESGKDWAIVFTDVTYGPHVEYGTTRMNARPHFRNTKAKTQPEVVAIMKNAVRRI